jgi:hypothetical protein
MANASLRRAAPEEILDLFGWCCDVPNYINETETLMRIEQGDRLVLIRPRRLTDAVDTSPSEDTTASEFRLGAICSLQELEELWAIDREAYGEASITYDKFKDWWL